MPWQNMLAQMPVIGGDLIQIDQLKRQNVQDERRNALADIAMQRGEEQYQQQRQDRLSAEQRQQAEQALSRAQWARGKPKAVIERQFPEVTANFEKQTGIPWAQADEGSVAQFTDDSIARLATGLGMAPPQEAQPAAPKYMNVGGTLLEVPTEAGGTPRVAYREPQTQAAPAESKPQLVEITLPDGSTQKQWVRPGESQGQPVGAPVKPRPAIAPKDVNTAKMKLTQIAVAKRQIANARQKFEAIRSSFSAGPGGGLLPTPSGKAFDAAIDGMRGSVTAITRVPGVGAMSDYETRLDQSKFPTRGDYEDVIDQKLTQLETLFSGLEEGYTGLLGGSDMAAPSAPTAPAPTGAPQPGEVRKGYRFKGGDPSNRGNWVKAQ